MNLEISEEECQLIANGLDELKHLIIKHNHISKEDKIDIKPIEKLIKKLEEMGEKNLKN